MTDWLEQIPRWARELLDRSQVARLGLLDDDGHPRVLPITFALHQGRIWSAIDRKPKRSTAVPARIRFLERRPEVAFTVDHYSEDWEQLAWVQLLGRAYLHDADEKPEALEALAVRYEPYRREPPPGPLIAIEIDRSLHWRARE